MNSPKSAFQQKFRIIAVCLVVPFQNGVGKGNPPSNMSAITKNRNIYLNISESIGPISTKLGYKGWSSLKHVQQISPHSKMADVSKN